MHMCAHLIAKLITSFDNKNNLIIIFYLHKYIIDICFYISMDRYIFNIKIQY